MRTFTTPNMTLQLRALYKIGNALAIIPAYDFHKGAVSWPKLTKIYAGFWLLYEILVTAWMIYLRSSHGTSLNFFKVSFRILGPCDTIILSMIKISMILGLSYCKQTAWADLNNKFQLVDKKFNTQNRHEHGLWKNIYVQLGVSHLLYFSCVAYSLVIRAMEKGVSVLKLYALYEFNSYYDFLAQFLIYKIAFALKNRYELLNERLLKAANEGDVSDIREVGKLSRLLGEMVQIFNNFFGLTILFIMARCVIKMLVSLNFFSNSLGMHDEVLKQRLEIAGITQTLIALVSTSLLILSCDAATSESAKSLFLCYKLRENFVRKSEERAELLELTEIVDKNRAVFTAGGFFEIGRSTFLGILGTTTTYLIVTLQFNQTWNSHGGN